MQSGTVDWCYDPNAGNPNAAYYQALVENIGYFDPRPMYADWQPKPGEVMQSFVGGSGACDYMGITDITANKYYTQTYGPCGQQNYFDCVEENDNWGLANDGVLTFSFCEGYDQVQNNWLVMGNSGSTFTDWTMVNSKTDESTHSPPNENGYGSFTCRWLWYN